MRPHLTEAYEWECPTRLHATGVRAPKNTLPAATAFLAVVVCVDVAICSLFIAAALGTDAVVTRLTSLTL